MPRRRPVLRRAALAVATVLAASVAACSGSTGTSAPSLTQVRALLARHGAAVLDRSAEAFLADVDTSAEAAGFRSAQSAQIAALATVPLTSWTYAVDAPVTNAAALDVASGRYHAPALIVRIELTFTLRGPGQTPTTQQLFWSFVRRHGHTLLAGDDDEAASGDVSWRGPWDFGPLRAGTGTASLVLAHADAAGQLPALVSASDSAVDAVTAVVGAGWSRGVTVEVASTTAEFTALTGGVSSSDVSAVTVFGSTGGTSGGAAIVVRPDALRTLSPLGLRIVLRHEVTHVATAAWTTPISPRWLIEGFAEYVGNLDSGQPVTFAARELATAVRAGQLPTALPADDAFAGSGAQLARVYQESWLACQYLASRVGAAGLVEFYRAVGTSTAANDQAAAEVLRTTLHETLGTFLAQWRGYLQDLLG